MADHYPESAKLSATHADNEAIVEFIEWLGSTGRIIGRYDRSREWNFPVVLRTDDNPAELINEFRNVDAVALERERRAMLEAYQQAASPSS